MHTEFNDATETSERTRSPDVGELSTRFRSHSEKGQRRSRTDWRLGGRAVSHWDKRVLAVSMGGVTLAIFGGLFVSRALPAGGGSLSLWITWLGLTSAAVYAFARGRPAGLLRFRPIDLVYATGFGVGLRLLQGVVSGANLKAFPTSYLPAQAEFSPWLWAEFIPAGVAGPIVEEMFFRAVVLVAIFQALRRILGSLSAGATALLFSAGTFVLLHCAFAPVALDEGLMLFLLGAVSAALVLLAGRIWGAVCLHIVYNVTFLLVAMVGGLSA